MSHQVGGIIQTIHGNTEGLKNKHTKTLLTLYDRSITRNQFIPARIARELSTISKEISRQVGILIDRSGRITHVIVGDAHQIFIPDLSRHRAGKARFRGLRLIQTHLRGENLNQDNLTDLVLLQLDCLVILKVAKDGLPRGVEVGYLNPNDDQKNEDP